MRKKERMLKLLSYLIDQPVDQYTTSKTLSEVVGVSSKTVLKDLVSPEMQRLLGVATIEKKEHVGIRIRADVVQRKQLVNTLYAHQGSRKEFLMSNSSSEDIEKICLALLQTSSGISKEKLSGIIFRDTSSLEGIFEEVERLTRRYEVTVCWQRMKGYQLEGAEENIRDLYRRIALQNIIIDKPDQLAYQESGIYLPIKKRLEMLFEANIVHAAIDLVDKSEINLNERFTNYDYEILVTQICIKISRMILGKRIKNSRSFDMTIREHLVAHLMIFQMDEQFHFGYDPHEHNQLTEILLSTRRINQQTAEDSTPLNEEAFTEFIRFIGSSLGAELTEDEELQSNLFLHLQPAIRRVRYGIQIENPLLNQIQLQHTNVYVSVLTGIEIIEKAEKINFNEDEIGFICLHIVAAMNRKTNQGYIKTVFVCDEGQAVMSFLASEIEKNFSEIQIVQRISSDQLKEQYQEIDVIFNATSSVIRFEKIPTLDIYELLNDGKMSIVRNWIINREYEKLADQTDTLKDSFLYYRDRVSSKEVLIKKYSDLLEEKGFVKADFAKSALAREKTIPTTLGRGIALPHGSSDFVKKSCILIIKLEEAIEWSGHKVDLVFLTAIDQEDVDIHRSFFEQLFKLVSNEVLLNQIKAIDDVDALKNILFPK